MNKKFGIIKGMLAFVVAIAMVFGALPISAFVPKALARGGTNWTANVTVADDETIDGDVTASDGITLTISQGKTLTVNGTLTVNEGRGTLTVNGKGKLIVNGADGEEGTTGTTGIDGTGESIDGGNGGDGDNGSQGGTGVNGNLIVNGTTVNITGGDGGNGGNGGQGGNGANGGNGGRGGNGGQGGAGADGGQGGTGIFGNITVNDATVSIIGGDGGNGGQGGQGGRGGVGDSSNNYGYDGYNGDDGDGKDGGIGVLGNVTVTNGSLTVNGGMGGAGGDYGVGDSSGGSGGCGAIGIQGDLTVTNGRVVITGGNGGRTYTENNIDANGGYGVYGGDNGNVSILGGTVEIAGGSSEPGVYAAGVYDSSISVAGGALTISGSVNCPGITLNGGSFKIDGDRYAPVTIAEGYCYADGTGNYYTSASDMSQYVFNGKTLAPVRTLTVSELPKFTSTSAGGTITSDKTGDVVVGSKVTLTVTPETGYKPYSVWYNDGTDHVITPVNGVYSFTMQNADTTIGASFVPDTPYGDYLVAWDDNDTQAGRKTVIFNSKQWYVIKDDSTAADAGTLTLLAKDPIGDSKFNNNATYDDGNYGNQYSISVVRTYLDNLTKAIGDFVDVVDAIEPVSLTTKKYNDNEIYDTVPFARLWLLSREEVTELPIEVRKCSNAPNASVWWLRSPGSGDGAAMSVAGNGSFINNDTGGEVHTHIYGIRPALKLKLSSVEFTESTKTFTMKSSGIEHNPYASLTNTTTPVKFNNMEWYIIEDESTSVNSGTLTLLSKDRFGRQKFNDNSNEKNKYSDSTIKDYLDKLWKGRAPGYRDYFNSDYMLATVEPVTVTTRACSSMDKYGEDVSNAMLWLLSSYEATRVNTEVKNFSDMWWLRSPGQGNNGVALVNTTGSSNNFQTPRTTASVRPALKLKLDAVVYDSGTKTFTVPYKVNIFAGENMTKDSGNESQTVTPGEAITPVVYTANNGYYFPSDYKGFGTTDDESGIKITRNSETQITISGTPTQSANIEPYPATVKPSSGGSGTGGTGGSGSGGSGTGGSGSGGSGSGGSGSGGSGSGGSGGSGTPSSPSPSKAPTASPSPSAKPGESPAPSTNPTAAPSTKPAPTIVEQTTDTKTNEDGTTTTTTTTLDSEGTKTVEAETVKNDGSVEKVTDVAKSDGSIEKVVETRKSDGTVEKVIDIANADGSTEKSTETVNPNGSSEKKTEIVEKDGSTQTITENVKPSGASEKIVDIEKVDGTVIHEDVKTTAKGKETSYRSETALNGDKTVTEQVKQPSGDVTKTTTSTTVKKDADGNIIDISTKIAVEKKTGTITTKTSFSVISTEPVAKKSALNSGVKMAAKKKNQVALTKVTTTAKSKTVTIPESVKADGKTYTVAVLKKGMLKGGKKKPTKVNLTAKGIVTVEKGAFGAMAKKGTIQIKGTKKQFKALKKLIVKSGLPKGVKVKRA